MTRDLHPRIAVHINRITESFTRRELSRPVKLYAAVKVALLLAAAYAAFADA